MGFVLIRVFFWHSFGAISALLKECLAPFLDFDSRSEIGLVIMATLLQQLRAKAASIVIMQPQFEWSLCL